MFCEQESLVYIPSANICGHLHGLTEIHFLPIRQSCTHALFRNTKYLTIDGQVCMLSQIAFTDAVEPQGFIS